MRPLATNEVNDTRLRAWGEASCDPFETHEWARCEFRGVVVLVLCVVCGRTPLEALNQLKIIIPQEEGPDA